MSISAIESVSAKSLNFDLASFVVGQLTTTNEDGSMTTIITTYANGTTSTVTEPTPVSSVVTRQTETANVDGTIATTTYYADGRTTTTIQGTPNPTAVANVLGSNSPVQAHVLLWA